MKVECLYRTHQVDPNPGTEFEFAIAGRMALTMRERSFLIGKQRRRGYLSGEMGNPLVLFDAETGRPLAPDEISVVLIPVAGEEDALADICAWGGASGYLLALDAPIEEIFDILHKIPDSQLDFVQGQVMRDFVADPERDYWDTVRNAIARSFDMKEAVANINIKAKKGSWKRRK